MWYEHAECGAVIKGAWEQQALGLIEAKLLSKSEGFQKSLIEWSKNFFSNKKKKINILQTKLKVITNINNTTD